MIYLFWAMVIGVLLSIALWLFNNWNRLKFFRGKKKGHVLTQVMMRLKNKYIDRGAAGGRDDNP